ncbi:MAG: gliding motility protein GldN [Bacteroidia bacterium]
MKRLKYFIAAIATTSAIFSAKAQGAENALVLTPPQRAYPKEHIQTRRPIPYTNVREADVMWSKRVWRVINLKEKFNFPLYYPITSIKDRKSLFDVLKDAALNDSTITCFSASDDEFQVPLTKSEVAAILVQWDSTHQTENPENPSEMILSPIKHEITSEDITKYWIKEDWFFDKQRSVMDVRILGILAVTAKKTENGDDAGGDKPLFWVYYPEIRPILANNDVYMRHNDAERKSFDDIFWKRMFSSYIIKESNVYDRYIGDYAVGMDGLLESERIKEDIFEFEHDFWQH